MTAAATYIEDTPPATTSVLNDLRQLALTSPTLARRQGWDYLRELGDAGRRDQLQALFGRGRSPMDPRAPSKG